MCVFVRQSQVVAFFSVTLFTGRVIYRFYSSRPRRDLEWELQYRGKIAQPRWHFPFWGRLRRRAINLAPTRRRGTACGEGPLGLGLKTLLKKYEKS